MSSSPAASVAASATTAATSATTRPPADVHVNDDNGIDKDDITNAPDKSRLFQRGGIKASQVVEGEKTNRNGKRQIVLVHFSSNAI